MASSREVQQVLRDFNEAIDGANKQLTYILEKVRELEQELSTFDADEDLNITRGVKREIDRGKREIEELRRNVDKLDRELSDTNRKYANLAR